MDSLFVFVRFAPLFHFNVFLRETKRIMAARVHWTYFLTTTLIPSSSLNRKKRSRHCNSRWGYTKSRINFSRNSSNSSHKHNCSN